MRYSPPPPNFSAQLKYRPSIRAKGASALGFRGHYFYCSLFSPCLWGEETPGPLSPESPLYRSVSGTWKPKICCSDGCGPTFTAYIDLWTHLPEGLCSHWSMGLRGGEGTAVYVWGVGGVWVLKLGCFTCHKVPLGARWSSQWKEEGRLLAGFGTVFPQFQGCSLSRSRVWSWTWSFLRR